jgi:predicted enzyme related to lactoylglutathione lyase
MPRVNHFAIPADVPERAISFYERVFDWQFKIGWEYDTPHGQEKYWYVISGGDGSAGIDGGLTRREYRGQPISVGIEVSEVEACDGTARKMRRQDAGPEGCNTPGPRGLRCVRIRRRIPSRSSIRIRARIKRHPERRHRSGY